MSLLPEENEEVKELSENADFYPISGDVDELPFVSHIRGKFETFLDNCAARQPNVDTRWIKSEEIEGTPCPPLNITCKAEVMLGGKIAKLIGLCNGKKFEVKISVYKDGGPQALHNVSHDLLHWIITNTSGDVDLAKVLPGYKPRQTPDFGMVKSSTILMGDSFGCQNKPAFKLRAKEKWDKYKQTLQEMVTHWRAHAPGRRITGDFFTIAMCYHTFYLPFRCDRKNLYNIHQFINVILNEVSPFMKVEQTLTDEQKDCISREQALSLQWHAATPVSGFYGGATLAHLEQWSRLDAAGRPKARVGEIFTKCLGQAIEEFEKLDRSDQCRIMENQAALANQKQTWKLLREKKEQDTLVNIPFVFQKEFCERTASEDKSAFSTYLRRLRKRLEASNSPLIQEELAKVRRSSRRSAWKKSERDQRKQDSEEDGVVDMDIQSFDESDDSDDSGENQRKRAQTVTSMEEMTYTLLKAALQADFPDYGNLEYDKSMTLKDIHELSRAEYAEEKDKLRELARKRPEAFAAKLANMTIKKRERLMKTSGAYFDSETLEKAKQERVKHSKAPMPPQPEVLDFLYRAGFSGTGLKSEEKKGPKDAKEIYRYDVNDYEDCFSFISDPSLFETSDCDTLLPQEAIDLLYAGCTDPGAVEALDWSNDFFKTKIGRALLFWSRMGIKLSHYIRCLPPRKHVSSFQLCPGVIAYTRSRGMKKKHRGQLGTSVILFIDKKYWSVSHSNVWLPSYETKDLIMTKPFFVKHNSITQLARAKTLCPMFFSMLEVSRSGMVPGKKLDFAQVPKTVKDHLILAAILQASNKNAACQAAQLHRYMLMQVCTRPLYMKSTLGPYLKKMPKPFSRLVGFCEYLSIRWGLHYEKEETWPEQQQQSTDASSEKSQHATDVFKGLKDIFLNDVTSFQEALTYHSLSCLCSDVGSENPIDLLGKIAALEGVEPPDSRIGFAELDEPKEAHEFDPSFLIGIAREAMQQVGASKHKNKKRINLMGQMLDILQYKAHMKSTQYLMSSVRKLCTMKASTHWEGFRQAFRKAKGDFLNVNNELDTLLKSSELALTEQESEHFIGHRKKLLEVIMSLVETLPEDDDFPMISLIEHSLKVIDECNGILVTLFAKPQLGAREISIVDECGRILQGYVENIFNAYLKFIGTDAMAKGDEKHFRMASFLESTSKYQKKGYEVFYMFDSMDCTKWCQMFMMTIFACLMYALEPEPNGIVLRALNAFARKRILLDDDQYNSMVELGKADEIILAAEEREVLDDFTGKKPGKLFKGVKNPRVMHVISGMMQGWIHSGSSVINASFLTAASTFFKTKATKMYNRSVLPDDERIKMLEAEGKLKEGMTPSERREVIERSQQSYPFMLKTNFSSSSDDVGLMWAMICKDPKLLESKKFMRTFLECASRALQKAYGYASIKPSTEKSACFGTNLLYEFLSIFFVGTKMFTAQLKFINGATSLKNENVIRKFQTVDYSAAMDMCANGIDALSACISLIVQSLWSYELLGAGTVTNWSNFYQLYEGNPSLLGGFRIICGPIGVILGESFAIWLYESGGAMGTALWSVEAQILSRYMYGGQDGSAEKISLAFLPVKEGLYKDFVERANEKGWLKLDFRDELNKPENWDALFTQATQPKKVKLLVSKTLMTPSMHDALNSSDKIEALMRGSYCLYSQVFRVKACLPRSSEIRLVETLDRESYQTRRKLTLVGFLGASKLEVIKIKRSWADEAVKADEIAKYQIELKARFQYLTLFKSVLQNQRNFFLADSGSKIKIFTVEPPSYLSIIPLDSFKQTELTLKELVSCMLGFTNKSTRVIEQAKAHYAHAFNIPLDQMQTPDTMMTAFHCTEMFEFVELMDQMIQGDFSVRAFVSRMEPEPVLAFEHALSRAYGRMSECRFTSSHVAGIPEHEISSAVAALMEAPFPLPSQRSNALRKLLEGKLMSELKTLSNEELSVLLNHQTAAQREIYIFSLLLMNMFHHAAGESDEEKSSAEDDQSAKRSSKTTKEFYLKEREQKKDSYRWREPLRRWGQKDCLIVPHGWNLEARLYIWSDVEVIFRLHCTTEVVERRMSKRQIYYCSSVTTNLNSYKTISLAWQYLMKEISGRPEIQIKPKYSEEEYSQLEVEYLLQNEKERKKNPLYNFVVEEGNTWWANSKGNIFANAAGGTIRITHDERLSSETPPEVSADIKCDRLDRSISLILRQRNVVKKGRRVPKKLEDFVIYKSKLSMLANMSNNVACNELIPLNVGDRSPIQSLNNFLVIWLSSEPFTDQFNQLPWLYSLLDYHKSKVDEGFSEKLWPKDTLLSGFIFKQETHSAWAKGVQAMVDEVNDSFRKTILKLVTELRELDAEAEATLLDGFPELRGESLSGSDVSTDEEGEKEEKQEEEDELDSDLQASLLKSLSTFAKNSEARQNLFRALDKMEEEKNKEAEGDEDGIYDNRSVVSSDGEDYQEQLEEDFEDDEEKLEEKDIALDTSSNSSDPANGLEDEEVLLSSFSKLFTSSVFKNLEQMLEQPKLEAVERVQLKDSASRFLQKFPLLCDWFRTAGLIKVRFSDRIEVWGGEEMIKGLLDICNNRTMLDAHARRVLEGAGLRLVSPDLMLQVRAKGDVVKSSVIALSYDFD